MSNKTRFPLLIDTPLMVALKEKKYKEDLRSIASIINKYIAEGLTREGYSHDGR